MSQSPLTPSQTAASPHLSSPYYDGPQYGPGTPNGAVRCASRASNHDSPYVGYSSPGPLPTAANCSAPLFAMEMKQRALLNSCLKTSMAEVNAWNEVASYESGGGAISHYNGGSTPGHATPGHSTPGHATPGHITPGHAMSLDAYGNAEVEELMDQQARAGVIQTFGNGALGEMPPRSHSSAGFYYGGGGAGGSTPLGPNGEVMSAPNSVISAHYSAASSPYGQPHSIHSSTSSSSSSMTPPSVKNGSSGGVLQRPNQTSPSLPFASSSKYCSDSVASSPVTSPLSAGSTLPQVRCHSNSSAAAAPLGTNNSNPNTPYTMNGPMTPGGGPMTPGPMTPGSGQQQQIGNPRTPGALKRDESTSSCGSPFPSNSSDYNNLFASGAKRFAPQGSPASSVSTLKRSPSVEPMSPYSSRLAMQVAPSPASLVNRNSASSPAAATPGTPYGAGQLVSSGLPIGYPNSNASAVTNPYMTPYHQPQYPPSYGMDSSAYGSEPDMEEENIFDDADEDEATFLSKRMAAGMYELNPVALLQNHLRIFEKNMVGQANAERDARQAKMVEAKRAMLAIQNSTNNSVNCHFGPNSSSSSYSGSSGYEPNFADDQKSMVSPSHPQTPFSPMSPAECVKYGQPPNGSRHSMIAPYSTPTSFGSYDLYSSHQQSFSSSASNSPSVASSAGGANGSTPSHQFSRQSSLTHPSSTPNSYGSMPSPSSLPTFHNSFKAMANSSTNSQLRSALRADFNDLLNTDPYAFPSFMDPPASMPRSHSTATSQPSSSASQSYSQPHSHAHTSHSHTSSSSSPSVTVSISSSLPPPSSQHSTAAASLHHILHSTNSSQSSAGDTPAKRPRGRPRANDPNRPPPKSKPAPSLASIIPIPGLPGQPAMKRGRGRPKSLKTLVKEAEAAVSQASANGGKVPEELLAYLEQQRAALAAQTAQSQTHQKLAERHQMMNMNRGAFASMMMTAPPTSIPPRFSLQHAINAASSAASRLSTAMSSTSSPRLTTSAGASNCVSTIQSTEQFKSAMSNYVSMATSHQSLSSSVSGTKLSLTTTNTTASSGGGSNKIRHLSDSSSDSSSDFSSDDSSDSSTDTDEVIQPLEMKPVDHRPLDPISTLTHLPPLKAPSECPRPPVVVQSRPLPPPASERSNGPGGGSNASNGGSSGPSSGAPLLNSNSKPSTATTSASSGSSSTNNNKKPSTADDSTSETSEDESSCSTPSNDDDTSSDSNDDDDDHGRDDEDDDDDAVNDLDDSLSSFSSSASSARRNRPGPRSNQGRRPSNGAASGKDGAKKSSTHAQAIRSATASLVAALKAVAGSSPAPATVTPPTSLTPPAAPAPKRRGRPKGSKNKPKVLPTVRPALMGKPKLSSGDSYFASTHLMSLSYSDEEDNRGLVGGGEQRALQQPVKKKRGRPKSTDRMKEPPPAKVPKLVLKLHSMTSSGPSSASNSRPSSTSRSPVRACTMRAAAQTAAPAPLTRQGAHQLKSAVYQQSLKVRLTRASSEAAAAAAAAASASSSTPTTRRTSQSAERSTSAPSTRLSASKAAPSEHHSPAAAAAAVAATSPKIRIRVPRTEAETFVCSQIERTLAPSQREREKTTHETAAKDAVGQAELAKREPEPVQPNKDAQQGANEVAASEMSATEEPSANGVDKAVKDVVGYLCDLAAIEVLQEQDPLGEELQQLLERKTLQELLFKMENAPISEDDSAVRNLQLVEFGDPHSNPFRIPATPPVTISRAAPVNALAGQHTDYFLGHPQMGPSFEVSSDEQSSAINSIINCGLEAPPEEEVIAAPVVVDLLIDNDAHQRFLAESGHSFDVESAVENEEEEADTAADHLMQLESTDAVAPEDASTMHNEPHQSPLTTLIEPANQHDTDAAGQTEAVNAAPAPPTQETQPETIESSLEVMPPVPTQPEQSFGTQQLPPVDENDFLEQIIINPPPSGLEEAVLKKDCLLEDQLQLDLTQLESSISVADLLPATETPLTTEPIFTPPPAMAALPPPPPQPDTSASDLALLDNLIQTEEANNEVVDSIFNMESQPPAQPQQSLVPLQPNQPSGTDFDPYSSNLAPLGTLPPAYQPVPTPVQPPMLGLRPDIVAAHQLGKMQHQSSLEHNLMLGQPQPHFASAQHSIYHRPVSHYPMISSHSPSHHPNYRANYSSAAALPPQSFPHSFQPFSAHNQPPPPIPHLHRPSGQLFPHGGDLRANVMHHHQPPLQSFHHSVQGPSLDELHRSPRYADIRSTNYRHIFGRETPPGVLQHVPPSGMLSSSQSHHQSYPPPHHSQLQSSLLGHKSQSQHHRTHFNPMLQQHLPPPQPMLSQHNAGGFHQSNQQLLSGPISRQQPHHAPVLPTGRPLGRPEYRPPPMQQMSSSNGAPLSYLGQSPSSLYLRPETPPSQQQYLQSPLAMAAVQARSTSPPRYHGSTTSHPGLHSTPNPNTPTPGAAFYSSAAPQIRPTPPVKPSQSAPNLSQLLSSINPTPPPPLDSATTKKIILEAKQPTMIRDKLESKLRNIPGLMTSEALHDFLSNKNMLGAISKATPGNNALKDILTEAMESIHQLDGDEVQRLLANATPRSRRMSTASDTAFSGQLGSGETNFLDEIFSDSYTSADQAGIEEEIRQLQELESFDNEGQAAVDPAMDAAMTAASASTSRRSSRGTTSADQLLVSLVEKSLLSLANTDKSKRQRSPDGQIRSLISEMVESVQHESDNEGAGSIYRPANVEAEPLSDLNESEKFNVTGHPLMASLMAPPNVVPKPKPKEIKPKPEKPARVTLKYLLETIDGDTDDDRRDMTTQMNPVLFAPSTAPQSVPRTSTITRPSETIEMIESTPLKPVEQHSSSTSFEDVFKPIEPMPSQTSFTPYEPNLMQMILTPRPKADTPPPPPPPPPPAPYRPPMSMPILSALSALESLDPSNQPPVDYLVDLQPERPPQVPNAVEPVIAPVMPVMQPEIIDLEADMDMEPPAMGNSLQPLLTTTAQQTNVEVPLDVVPLEPVVAALPKRTDSPQVAAETAPIADIAVDSKPVEAVQSSPAEAARTTTPDQQICVDLLNDIVEMASGSVEPSTPPASPPRFDLDDKSKLAASDSARHLLLEDIIFDKTADSEVSKLFSNQLSTKRRRSMEVFVSLTNHSVSGSSTSPLISSTNAAAAKRCIRTNSLKSIDDFTSSLTPRFTESRSTPESRATSPDRSPTPVISTTHDQHRDLSLTDLGDSPHQCHSGETKDDHLHFSSSPLGKLRRLDFGDGDCDLDDVPSRTILDLPPKSTTPPPVFRARSRSLVIDVRNSELSLKTTTTDASNNTKQDVIFDFSQFVNANSKRTKKNQNNSRPTKRAKVETITSSSEEDEAACASTGKEPSVQHPDISSSVDDEKSCRFKHRKCCCHAEEDFDTEETETESDCSNARHRCCHRHHGSTATNTGEQSHSVLLKSTGGAEVPPPVTIHHHSSTGIPTVSINFNAENATTIIHINPSNNNNNKTNTGAAGDSTAATSKPIDN